ncbi:hypothetical protein [Flavobacterium sp. TAB 87]|uniref:DUF6929 family protein n=1 Tax=Flavobacterium sp. TAB 87 TaxID=1729581 RepID=UPI00076C48E0|nr:hypothetical protein [Flavobacterium sp. TAB 87]KVV15576.1 hypothetical protein AP058_00860 [Flavobacterium sp. TAB 87]
MEKFTLEILFHIIGIGSASGLIYQNNSLYVIGDNSGYLYEYNMDSKLLNKHPLVENATENTPKKDKSDFESIAHFGDTLYVFGSGSTANRNKMIEFNIQSKTKTKANDLVDLYAVIQNFADIRPEDFNVEGAIFEGENWYLFNRGNGSSNKNTIFTIHAKNLGQEFALVATNYKLPKIKGVRSSFTDAVLVDDKIYFLATVEDTKSTYEDGEVLGSFVGRMDVKTMKIDFTQKITDTNKFEGITLYEKTKSQITFLLCEDNDTESQETSIFKLSLPLSK